MVFDYYNLKEDPFGVTPDPRFLYSSPSHREALASLLYGIRCRRGFMSLIAKPGMGKTTVLFQLLSQLQGSARTVFLFQTLCSPKDLLRGLMHDLGVGDDPHDVGSMQEQLNQVLLGEARQGRTVVVVIDEAQNLEDSALELLRMLSNFETARYKLMQIILAGQPKLRDKLASPELVQLRQRMSIFSPLSPLSVEETQLYLRHRLQVAGYRRRTPLFTPQAAGLIAKYSEGIPRNINNICFNALALGYVLKQKPIQEDVVRETLRDLDLESQSDDLAETETEPTLVPIRALQSQNHLSWLRRAIICIILLLPILKFAGDGKGTTTALAAHSKTTPSRTSQFTSMKLLAEGQVQPRASIDANDPMASKPAASTAGTSAHQSYGNLRATSSTPSQHQESQPHVGRSIGEDSDPIKLWAEVKKQNSDAEVELADLYIAGTAVPKNCDQAQILLRAASRRGNLRAGKMLHDFEDRCR